MQKQAIFQSRLLPYALVAPQLAIVLIFFYWPAAQAVIQSFLLQDAFGLSTSFVWFDNYLDLFSDAAYFEAIVRTFFFSFAIAVSSLSVALLLAVMADKPMRGGSLYRTLLIWPYAVAPPVVGVLWIFMLHPSLGVLSRYLREAGIDWESAARRRPGRGADHPCRRVEADLI
ncbi:ABC-type sugar transport system permease subunit [Bradyrhizobium sp. LM6.10]